MFEPLSFEDPWPIALLKRAILVLFAVCLVLGVNSGYRAYVQVRSLELDADGPTLRSGSTVRSTVVISGRTDVDVRIELIQGTHAEVLATLYVPGNEWASLDPRSRRASQSVVVTPSVRALFAPGPVRVRATAVGRPQWLRLPPPVVRELEMEIERDPSTSNGERLIR